MNMSDAFGQAQDVLGARLAPRTAKTYHYALLRFAEWLQGQGITDTAQLTTPRLIAYHNHLAATYPRHSTRATYTAATKVFIDWLVMSDLLDLSTKDDMRLRDIRKLILRKRESRLPRWPTDEQVQAVRLAAHTYDSETPRLERNIALAEFLYSTGCRAGEAAALRCGDVDLEAGQATVMGKGDKERLVFLTPDAARALRLYWQARGNALAKTPAFLRHDYGWQRKQAGPPLTTKTIWQLVTEWAKVAGVAKFSPHYFRHYLAITALQKTGNLAIVQDMLGHADPSATRIYAKITPGELKSAHRTVFG